MKEDVQFPSFLRVRGRGALRSINLRNALSRLFQQPYLRDDAGSRTRLGLGEVGRMEEGLGRRIFRALETTAAPPQAVVAPAAEPQPPCLPTPNHAISRSQTPSSPACTRGTCSKDRRHQPSPDSSSCRAAIPSFPFPLPLLLQVIVPRLGRRRPQSFLFLSLSSLHSFSNQAFPLTTRRR